MDIRNQFRRPYRTDKPFLDIPQALAYLANFRCPSGTTGQRDNPTRRPMTDGSRDATLGFSREATSEISRTRVPGTLILPPNSNSSRRDNENITIKTMDIRNQFRRPYGRMALK